jgi:hypothetical protein
VDGAAVGASVLRCALYTYTSPVSVAPINTVSF